MATPELRGYTLSSQPIYSNAQLERYATDDPTIYVEKYTSAGGVTTARLEKYLGLYESWRMELTKLHLEAYTPEIVDHDLDGLWIAYSVSAGSYSFKEVMESFPDGLDGRDWAWICNRILLILDKMARPALIDGDNLLVHPEGHGVILIGWTPSIFEDRFPLDDIRDLMEESLLDSVDAKAQIDLMANLAERFKENRKGHFNVMLNSSGSEPLSYETVRSRYKHKLETLYGPPIFRAFEVSEASTGFGQIGES